MLKIHHLKRCAVLTALLMLTRPATSEDTDIFVGGTVTAAKPNILIVLDNSSNWSASLATDPPGGAANQKKSKFYHEVKALTSIMTELGKCDPSIPGNSTDQATCATDGTTIGDSLRLGLMMFTETGTNGGYVRFGIRDMNGTNRTAFSNLVNGFVESGNGTDNSASNQPYSKVQFETFKYFGGYTSPAKAALDQSGGTNDATHFGPTAYAGWGTDSGSDKGAIRRDYVTNKAQNHRAARDYNADANSPLENNSDKTYESPISEGCAKNFVIFISNGSISQNGGDSGGTSAQTLLTNVGGNTTQIKDPVTGVVVHDNYADEFSRFLYETDVSSITGKQNVISYTLAVYDKADETQTATQSQIKLANSMARVGGGKYFAATDGNQLLDSLLAILNEIQAVNSTFVTASLPVNTNSQGEFVNQVFIGMFRPDAQGLPRWWGNVKQYRLACLNSVTGTEDSDCQCTGNEFVTDAITGEKTCPVSVQLVDSGSSPKIINSSSTGFIAPDVTSFWTTTSTYWANDAKGTPPSQSDKPDGEVVEKGGAAQRLRTLFATEQATRKVFTCPVTGCVANASLPAFNYTGTGPAFDAADAAHRSQFFASTSLVSPTSTATYGSLSAADQQTAFKNLIDWLRGKDNAGDEKGPGAPTTVRPSIHGDVVHSRPIAIDYGDPTGVVIFYGTNDGMLHAAKGSQTAADGGDEMWAFVAPEAYAKLNRQRVNTPVLKVPTTPGGIDPAPQPKDYFWDGPVGAYQDKASGKVYLFIGARRGGKFIYALDVSTPTNPKVLWKITNDADNSKDTAGFSKLGFSFSTPTLMKLKASSNPVLVVGGGYAGGYDSSLAPICEDKSPRGDVAVAPCDEGKGVYFINAFTGALIKHVNTGADGATAVSMNYSVPGDVAQMDSDFDGNIDRVYVGDLGGNLWRIEIDDADPNNWKARIVAKFGTDRKLFFRPAVLQQQSFTALMIGSGDREKPLDESTSDDFYLVKDKNLSKLATTDTITALTTASLKCLKTSITWTDTSGSSFSRTCTGAGTDTDGWLLMLQGGEKVINAPKVAFGILNFATNKPTAVTAGQCSNLGEARSYQLEALDGVSAFSDKEFRVIPGGGLPPTTFVGIVKIGDAKVPVLIGGGLGDKPPLAGGGGGCVGATCAQSGRVNVPPIRHRKYRYNKVDSD